MVKIFNRWFTEYPCYIMQVVMDTDIITVTEEGICFNLVVATKYYA